MADFDDVMAEFLIESREGLDQLDQDLVALEENPQDHERLARIFRCFHTIKGTAGFLGFGKLETLTHAGENLLSRMRDGQLIANAEITSALLESLDAVRQMLGEVEASGNDGEEDFASVTQSLLALSQGAGTSTRPAAADVLEPSKPSTDEAPALADEPAASPVEEEPAQAQACAPPEAPDLHPGASALEPPHAFARAEEAANDVRHATIAENVRVDVNLLDGLVDLAGELVLTRNHLVQLTKTREDPALTGATQRLNLVTAQLQTGIMRMRMQPVSTLFTKFPRLVRDLAHSCRKLVRLEVDGGTTELDKSLLEAIKDPLTHLLRNCIDHGIEPPDVRAARGKHHEGRVALRSFHQNGMVHVEISDDGGGIPLDKVRKKAIARGFLSEERASTLSESEIASMIFLPGFSTADQITHISGRGVGMDVVKTNVEQIGGTVLVDSRPGVGTTFTLKIPLTLAIVPAVVIESDADRFAVPQVNVLELVRLDRGHEHGTVEWIHGAPVYRLRDTLLPIVFLSEVLTGSDPRRAWEPSASDEEQPSKHLIVLQGAGRQFGLVVDAVRDHQEIVVKPLPRLLSDVRVFAGATLLGDGRVALILDVTAVAERAHVFSALREETFVARREQSAVHAAPLWTLLVLRGPDDARLAVPLDSVARLETIEQETVEGTGRYPVVQYRGNIMPLLRVSELLPERRAQPRNPQPAAPGAQLSVVVFGQPDRPIGLVVDDVLDVIDTHEQPRPVGCREGVRGTLVLQERITEVLDLDWFAAAAGLASLQPEIRRAG